MRNIPLNSTFSWALRHYRWILFILFAVYMVFFDRYSLINQYKIHKELKTLRDKSDWYKHQTEMYHQRLHQVLYNPAETERFVRENYLMQRPGEKVFIIDR